MTRSAPLQVFKGGWEELENAVFTDNQASVVSSIDGMFIKPDGTKIFILRNTVVETYPLAVPWDVNTIGTIEDTYTITEGTSVEGLAFKDDGTKMYTLGITPKLVFEYSLPTPWVPSSIIASSVSISYAPPVIVNEHTIKFSRDGDFFFIVTTGDIFSFPLPIPWDITSNVTDSFFAPFVSTRSLEFKTQGDLMYIGQTSPDQITEYRLSPPWDITTAALTGNIFPMGNFPSELMFRSNGKELIELDAGANLLIKFYLYDAWDISTASHFTNSFDTGSVNNFSIFWKHDGTKFFTLSINIIKEWTPVAPWNMTGATAGPTFSVMSLDTNTQGMWWKPDGTRCYIIGVTNLEIQQLDLGTPWDVSTMSDPAINKDISGQDTTPAGITFRADGKKLWFCGQTTKNLYERDMATPWDIATSTVGVTKNFPDVGNLSHGIFRTDGKMLFTADRGAKDEISRYLVPIPWDVTSIGSLPEDSLFIGDKEAVSRSVFIREDDGKKLFISGNETELFSYDMSLEFNNAIINNFGDEFVNELDEVLIYA